VIIRSHHRSGYNNDEDIEDTEYGDIENLYRLNHDGVFGIHFDHVVEVQPWNFDHPIDMLLQVHVKRGGMAIKYHNRSFQIEQTSENLAHSTKMLRIHTVYLPAAGPAYHTGPAALLVLNYP